MKVVIKVGGSLCMGDHGPDPDYFERLIPVLENIDEKHRLSVGIGGGDLVRNYGEAISHFDLSDREREECFIKILSANVLFLSYLLGKQPLLSFESYEGGEVVVGGAEPGRSTDANAALVAKEMGADLFLILTDVDGIYEKDPDEHKDAEKIDELGFGELEKFSGKTKPLDYGVVDPTALRTVKENKIETFVINGEEPENIFKALEGEDIGTHIA